ncbi:MAG: hypothetical protein IKQ95_10595 [Synergistaceae bacterium]|nr:hypothetical protein [Synergistaceae bacterium]
MRRINLSAVLFLAALLFFCEFSTWPASASVTIGGTPLSEISDVVKAATRSEFPELPKHSILLYERFTGNGGINYSPRIFTVSNDGSMRKEYKLTGSGASYAHSNPVLSPRENVVQKMDVSVSNKRFGMRRNIFYSIAGGEYCDSYHGTRTLETSGTENSADIHVTSSPMNRSTFENRSIWGNACLTVKGISDDIFVHVHSSVMAGSGSLYFNFSAVQRNETGTNMEELIRINGSDRLGWKIFDYNNGIRGAGIAGGDFDGDGYRNDIALCWNDNDRVYAYFYTVTFAEGQLNVQHRYTHLLHEAGYWSTVANHQASPIVVAGDFNGDGKDEAAFVNKVFPYGEANNHMRVTIISYNKDTKNWELDSDYRFAHNESACKAARWDFDGDGKDELAILIFIEVNGALYPHLEYWYCENGSIRPRSNISHLATESILGYSVAGDAYNQYYKIAEDFCITAGPVTGTKGKVKLAEDIVISHVNEEASRVFVISAKFEDGRFAGFGEAKKLYEAKGNDPARRGAVITGDFANESLMLDKPKKTVDKHDESFVAVIQAFPYHVDNVDTHGNLLHDTVRPVNYTYSEFDRDEGNGYLRITYSNTSTKSVDKTVSFGMASTTETIAVLGDAGQFVHGYLSFKTAQANIAGNFDPRIKAGASVANSIMDFITDRIDETTTKATRSARRESITDEIVAQNTDRTIMYTAPQYIWRYRILNDPLPSWFRKGPRADQINGPVSADRQENYLTFSMFDSAQMVIGSSEANYSYNERHEEGNFFSYPVSVTSTDGYHEGGKLMSNVFTVAWSKSPTTRTLHFEQEKIESQTYDEQVKKSGLSKLISAVAALFGADDPTGLPPYTSHNESFTKAYSTNETLEMKIQARSTLPSNAAGHTLKAMPYVTREGVMRVATAVELALDYDTEALWSKGSIYRKFPDPALVLPRKYIRNGGTIDTNPRHASASLLRGIRYYVPELALDSNSQLLGGLTYKISVPLYNASFLDTGDFEVRLSYVSKDAFDAENPRTTMDKLQPIQTITMSMGGWSNAKSSANKGWAEFTWDVPQTLEKGDYYFYVQIDPGKHLEEVHESRLSDDGTLTDIGGNNEGYIGFHITQAADAVKLAGIKASESSLNPTPKGAVFRTAYRPGDAGSGNVESAVRVPDKNGKINVNVTFQGYDEIGILYFLSLLWETVNSTSPDALPYTVPVECEVEYNGDEYYPEVYLYGFNYKPGAMDSVNGDESLLSDDAIGEAFLIENISLVPHTRNVYTIHMNPSFMEWRNGVGFEIVVPELSVADVSEDASGADDDSGGDESGGSEVIGIGSTSGGCEAGAGISAALILAGAFIFRKAKEK